MTVLVPPSVRELDTHLKGLVKWERFALQLPHMEPAYIQIIQRDKKDDVESQRIALYEKWLKVCPNPSWNDVITALMNVDENAIAKSLNRRFFQFVSTKPLSSSNPLPTSSSNIQSEYEIPASIVDELEKLHETFVPLVIQVKRQIQEKMDNGKVSVQTLASYVQEHLVGPACQTNALSITSTTNVEQILQSVKHQYTFLSPNLILNLASFFLKYHPIAKKVDEYKSRITAFKRSVKMRSLKNELGRFNKQLRHSSSNTILKLLVTNAWGEQSIRLVETLLLTLFPIVHPDDLPWYSVCAGSILLSFIVTNNMMLPLIVSCARKMELMRHLGIISVTIGNVLIHVNKAHDDSFSFEDSLMQATARDNIEAVEFLLKYTQVDVNAVNEDELFIRDFFSEHLQQRTAATTLTFLEVHVNRLRAIRDDIHFHATRGPDDPKITNEFLQEIEHHILNTQYLRNRLNHLPNPIKDKLDALYANVDELKALAKIGHLHKFFQSIRPLPNTTLVTITLNKVWSECSVMNIENVIVFLFASTSIDKFYWFRVKESRKKLEIQLLHARNPDLSMQQLIPSLAQALGVIEIRLSKDEPIFRNKSNEDNYTFEKGIRMAQGFNYMYNVVKFLKQVLISPCPYFHHMFTDPDHNNNFQSVPDDRSPTPLMIACCISNSKLVQLLLEHGADPNIKTSSLNTALFFSLNDTKIFKMLLDHGANAEIVNRLEDTILRCACGPVNSLKIVKTLIKKEYSLLNRRCVVGSTALFWACQHGNLEILNILLEAKADPSIPDNLGATPLWKAAYFGYLPIVERLIEAGEDLNIPDKDNRTPLWVACGKGHIAIVKYLLHAKADPFIPDNEGVRPLQIAYRCFYFRIASVLFNHILANCQTNEEKVAWIAEAQKQLTKSNFEFLLQAQNNPSIFMKWEALQGLMTYIEKTYNIPL